MPEIIAKTYIEEISRKDNIPVLFVELDEHFHEELFNTRLEAFVDIVRANKNKNFKNKEIDKIEL
jgi:predicted nucleotide-binding protein (sugar kinase/HSP70/actin superfamily)